MKEENNEIVSAAETISVDYEEILQRAVAVIENARTSCNKGTVLLLHSSSCR